MTIVALLFLISQADEFVLAYEVGPSGPLTRKNFVPNLQAAETEADAMSVLLGTRLSEYRRGAEKDDIQKLSARELRSISPASARLILSRYYKLNTEQINLIYESEAWNSWWRPWKPHFVWGGSIAGSMAGFYGLEQLSGSGIFYILLVATIPFSILSYGALIDSSPGKVTSDNLFEETAVKVNWYEVKALRALIEACSRAVPTSGPKA